MSVCASGVVPSRGSFSRSRVSISGRRASAPVETTGRRGAATRLRLASADRARAHSFWPDRDPYVHLISRKLRPSARTLSEESATLLTDISIDAPSRPSARYTESTGTEHDGVAVVGEPFMRRLSVEYLLKPVEGEVGAQ